MADLAGGHAGSALGATFLAHGHRPAIVDDEGEWSSADVSMRAAEVAAALADGHPTLEHARVVLLARPGLRYVAGLVGIWRAGGVAVPLSPAFADAERDYVCVDSDARLAVVDPAFAERLAPAAAARGIRTVVTGGSESGGGPAASRVGPAASRVGPAASPEAPALILYTSGTTSRPKGVVLTHGNLEFQTRCLCEAWAWSADDRILHVLPLHHVHGIVNALLCALRAGAICEMLPRFDAGRVWARLAGGGVTLFMAVPTIYARLIGAWDAADGHTRARWSSGARQLRLMVSGSAALPVSVLQRWKSITGHMLLERYGMTEIGMALSNPLGSERRPGTVGQPLPGVDVQLLDETGCEVVPGAPGEIHVRSAGVFAEYRNRPADTAAAFRAGGWFRTGDVAVLDDGYYRILGRLSVDIIKTGGEKVSALEIEEVLRHHPAIADCAVVGVADAAWGEQVSAAVVLRGGEALTLEELRAWAKERLSRWKIPGRLLTVDGLPRNALGKVVKADVRGLFERGCAGLSNSPEIAVH